MLMLTLKRRKSPKNQNQLLALLELRRNQIVPGTVVLLAYLLVYNKQTYSVVILVVAKVGIVKMM